MLTQKTLKESLVYDGVTGLFTWKTRPTSHFPKSKKRASDWIAKNWNSKHSGNIAGTINLLGYNYINIFGNIIGAHRLVILYVDGYLPKKSVDHIDGNKLNNTRSNLNASGQIENSKNCVKNKNNTSGLNGVYFNKGSKRWIVKIKVDYKSIHIGTFDTIEQAAAARLSANKLHGFTERHGE